MFSGGIRFVIICQLLHELKYEDTQPRSTVIPPAASQLAYQQGHIGHGVQQQSKF
jgi:hypothetical protein